MDETREKLTKRLKPAKTALIVVDVQNDFCHPEGAFGKRGVDFSFVGRVMPRLKELIDGCRRAGVRIVFVRTLHGEWTDSPAWRGRMSDFTTRVPICAPGTWGAELYGIEPGQDDYLVTKHRYSGFVGTDLDLVLRSKGIETLLVTGFTSNVCVESTARDAFHRDYSVVLVEDCCEAPLPGEHASTVRNIATYFGLVADSKTVLSVLGPGA